MLKHLFNRGQRQKPQLPEDCLVHAIGDIHGRDDLLEPLLSAIDDDLSLSKASRRVVIFLGDYIDRGPASNRVLDRLVAFSETSSAETHFVRGNHEDCLLAFLREPSTGPGWCEFGGRETLWSYGVTPPARRAEPQEWTAAADALRQVLPSSHLALLSDLKSCLEIGDYFFTHAGARPGVALVDQTNHDLMWIRGDFLDAENRFERVIVHGHTPEPAVMADQRRIGIDTGAYATGVLTALRLQGKAASLIQTQVVSGEVTVQTVRQP
jgi:serine/threonine protein phosphatase 1